MSEQTQEVVRYDGNAPVKTSKNLAGLLERPDIQSKLARVAAKNLTPERIVGILLMAASRQPKLLECTQASLLKSAMTSISLGLDCSGILGRAYLVPFYNKHIRAFEALFIPGYLGLGDLARKSGDIKSLVARVVYKDEWFEVDYSADIPFIHKPDLYSKKEDSNIVGAYFYGTFLNGGHHFEWMNIAEIEAIREVSKAKDSGPWVNWYPDMVRKTVFRKGVKFCPLSTESQQLIAKAEEDEYTQEPPSRAVERGSIRMEDLQPVGQDEPVEQPPIDVEPSEHPAVYLEVWNKYQKELKLSKEGIKAANDFLAEEYGTMDFAKISEITDLTNFQMFTARCTSKLEEDEWIKK